jgi:hypothetical protein
MTIAIGMKARIRLIFRKKNRKGILGPIRFLGSNFSISKMLHAPSFFRKLDSDVIGDHPDTGKFLNQTSDFLFSLGMGDLARKKNVLIADNRVKMFAFSLNHGVDFLFQRTLYQVVRP